MSEISYFEHIICLNASNKRAFLWKIVLIHAAFNFPVSSHTTSNAATHTRAACRIRLRRIRQAAAIAAAPMRPSAFADGRAPRGFPKAASAKV